MSDLIRAAAPVTRRVRAYFAPVDRVTGTPTIFDPAGLPAFDVDAPSSPWVDLGWCSGFKRHSGTKVSALMTGAPATASGQVRTEVDATVDLQFESWGKLQLALAAGVQQMNVLAALAAVPVVTGSTANSLQVGAAGAGFSVGDVVVVDVDYAGTTGFVGSGVSGGFVKNAAAIGSDVDYVRRVSLNVARVTSNAAGVIGLGSALLAGVPAAGMQVSKVVGFCDREGGSFFQEWSGLFVLPGEQGDLVAFHYPRLQAFVGPGESAVEIVAGVEKVRLSGSFRALPVKDVCDGEMVVCYRTYVPGSMRVV